MKLTIKPNGKTVKVTPLSDGVEIEFTERGMDLWEDRIEMWLEKNDTLTDYAKFSINKKYKMNGFRKS